MCNFFSFLGFKNGDFFHASDVTDLPTWNLKVDESITPSWYSDEKTRAWCEVQVGRMIVRDARGTLLGGCWIFDGPKASVKEIVCANLDGANLARAYLTAALPSGWKITDTGIVVRVEK